MARAELGASIKYHPDADTTELRRELRVGLLSDAISRSLAQAPPLTVEDRCALAALLIAPGAEVAA